MSRPEENIDTLIRAALSTEEAQAYDDLGEQSIIEGAIGVLKGRAKLITGATVFGTFVMFGLSVFSAFQFFDAEATKDLIMWATGFIIGMSGTGFLKTFYWMEMEKYATIREIKRVELQLSHLARKLEERQ